MAACESLDGPPEREVSVRSLRILVHEHVEGAVHRLDLVFGPLNGHRVEHGLGVEVVVARGLPQVDVGNVRRVDEVVSALQSQPGSRQTTGRTPPEFFGTPPCSHPQRNLRHDVIIAVQSAKKGGGEKEKERKWRAVLGGQSPPLDVDLLPVALNDVPHAAALGVPEDEPSTGTLLPRHDMAC